MTRTVYTIEHRCPGCGGTATQSFAEEVGFGRLIWWESWHCPGCRHASEGDGIDRLPDELRDYVIAKEGSFRVDLHPRDKLGLMRVFRDEFGMSPSDAIAVYNLLPFGFRTSLTRTEASCIAAKFSPEIAEATIEAER